MYNDGWHLFEGGILMKIKGELNYDQEKRKMYSVSN